MNFDFSVISIALLACVLVDLDHLAIAPIRKWRMHLDFDIPRKLPLHNYIVLPISFALSFSIILNKMAGAFFMGIFLHLLWDALEKIFIFKKNLKEWETI